MNEQQQSSMKELAEALASLTAGEVADDARGKIVSLLESCWSELSGAHQGGMASDKLYRAEELRWDPPVLSFVIERHGATVNGSSRAALQTWWIDPGKNVASFVETGYRRLTPRAARLDVKKVAASVCEAVLLGPGSDYSLVQREIVIWNGVNEIDVWHGKLVSGSNQQTITSRRKRFRKELIAQMLALVGSLQACVRQ
jgi:hypothetical protein